MSTYMSGHMTSHIVNGEMKVPNLSVNLTHCVQTASIDENAVYERLQLDSHDEDIHVTLYMKTEQLRALHSALEEYLLRLPEFTERGDCPDFRGDVRRESRDFTEEKMDEREESAAVAASES